MLSFIMSSSGIHHARVTEVNKQLMGYIIPIGWWLVIAMMVLGLAKDKKRKEVRT